MKKQLKYLLRITIILLVFIGFSKIINNETNLKRKQVLYQGNQLFINVDGNTSATLPTSGTYYLTKYNCDNENTKVTWNKSSHELTFSNGKEGGSISCNLVFKSNPKLAEMPAGSYVAYTGSGGTVGSTQVQCQTTGAASSEDSPAETEAPNSCLGQNARQDLDTTNYTYGYCYSGAYPYNTTGWRVAYIDTTTVVSNSKAVIISAGSPECNSRASSVANDTYIKIANAKALKYCNIEYVDGNCNCTDSNADGLCDEKSTDAWAVNDTDFYYMTKAISGYGKRLTESSSSLGDSGGTLGTTLYCSGNQYKECGYNNDLIDNGGSYWFASKTNDSYKSGPYWGGHGRAVVSGYDLQNSYGLRPVISLSSSVYVTGGSGTMSDPYTIGNDTFILNNGNIYLTEVQKSSVQLTLVSQKATTMCISVNNKNCNNYINFTNNYTLDMSNEEDGEKVVYVYYKDSEGNIFASMNKSIILDTIAPTNNSVTIGSENSTSRTLTLNSTGANYMCFSNTSSNAGDCTNWVPYANSYTWKLSDGEGTKTVYAFFKDSAGNISDVVSDTITFTKSCLGVGEVYAIDYSGESVTSNGLDIKLCTGTYNMQVWGAQGGNTGGKGGYSTGDITLDGTESLYFYVGGAGAKGTAGFNGGGASAAGAGGGGGASDIRIGSDSLYARVIVAGGGGGKGQDSCGAGGAGGGISGIGGLTQGSCQTQGGAGTQTAGGAVGVYNTTNGANPGTFGIGGTASDASYDGGAGGGGWYGGGAGASSSYGNGGGGGSGFIFTSDATLPDGYLVNTNYYLSNASTLDGTQTTIPNTAGTGTETGHTGNGYIKITRLS